MKDSKVYKEEMQNISKSTSKRDSDKISKLERENRELREENKSLVKTVEALHRLNSCYRLGTKPPEWVFKALEKRREKQALEKTDGR